MKITIIGGSKGTGAELATVAMDADHDVTVVSRSGTGPAGATIVTADASAPPIPGRCAMPSPEPTPSWSPSAARRA